MRFGGNGGGGRFGVALLAGAAILAFLLWRGELGLIVAGAALVALGASFAIRRKAAGSREQESRAAAAANAPGPPISAFPDPVILVDLRAVVVDANDAARTLLPGLRERQPLAFALRDPELLDALPIVAASGTPAAVEIGGRMPNEQVYEVRIRPLGPAGEGTGPGEAAVALFFRDLTAERRTERMRVDFIANVSHELRTPLASLAGFIDTLKGPAREDPPARERFLEIMGAQASRMTRLIDDLLQLSRVELREHLPPSQAVDLASTLSHMVEVMAPLARERGATIALDLPEGPVEVMGDRDELLRLIENLVENAVKYGGGGPVEVSLRRIPGGGAGGQRVELSVRDHGPGIPPEHLPRLTERFYRVDVAESRREGGTGLGLAIVKHIVGRHRGRLLIESEPGQGATFRVQMPAAPLKAGAVI